MQEGVLLEPDINERGLEAVFEIADFALVNAADQPVVGGALNRKLLELPSSSTATRVSSDSALMTTSLCFPPTAAGVMSRLTFLMTLLAACLMLSTMPWGGGSARSTGSNFSSLAS